jgi:MinD superfamily P-loop ATPase
MRSVYELAGRDLDLARERRLPKVDATRCASCGNCTRCRYLAIELDARGIPAVEPSRCTGCGECVASCFVGAMALAPAT